MKPRSKIKNGSDPVADSYEPPKRRCGKLFAPHSKRSGEFQPLGNRNIARVHVGFCDSCSRGRTQSQSACYSPARKPAFANSPTPSFYAASWQHCYAAQFFTRCGSFSAHDWTVDGNSLPLPRARCCDGCSWHLLHNKS